MIIINPEEVFEYLMIFDDEQKSDMIKSSYSVLSDTFKNNQAEVLKYLIDNQISESDFVNSINYMEQFYMKYEDYIKCEKLKQIREYIVTEYSNISTVVNS